MTFAAILAAAPSPARAADATSWSYPVSPYYRSGYGYGTNVGSMCGVARKHLGIDLGVSVGQTVRAAANGVIRGTFFESRWGWAILVEHRVPGEGTVITRYANVNPRSGYGAGRVVARGEAIATVYNLGSNTHHHFSVRKGEYDRWAWRGYLPAKACGDPAFPGGFVDPTDYIRVHSDTAPPVTRISLTRSIAAYRSGWTRGTWIAALRCTDDISGCARTYYSLNNTTAKLGTKFSVGAEGITSIYYRSIDVRGNREDRRGPAVIGIDRTDPTVAIDETVGTFPTGNDVVVNADGGDPAAGARPGASGMYGVTFRFCAAGTTECASVAGTRSGTTWTARPPTTLGPGAYTVTAIARDRVGNTASDEFAFSVLA